MIRRLAVVGLGLLGGSAALAARRRGVAREIVAIGRRPDALARAVADGVVDRATVDVGEGVRGVDVVLLATPVATIEALLPDVWRVADPDATVTDVGSTKGRIVSVAEALAVSRPLAFVGGHPMAGSEQSGYGQARADLFVGATVILTPTEASDAGAVKRVSEFWQALGGRVVILDPELHDRVVGMVSHLPHLLAFALVDAVLRSDPAAVGFAGRGFADTTRIAASDPRIWRDIFLGNREALAQSLVAFRAALADLERLIAAGDASRLEAALGRIRAARQGL
ncbi:MAG: prephenate dehydrogenase/arogenate dehydrogenase family protein [Candidatus Rokubacteria bacterium]|nr:prephenate dehydrogenase/arogenate dehydrogenase family protein [Candidatus Rokubacteria bacterium]